MRAWIIIACLSFSLQGSFIRIYGQDQPDLFDEAIRLLKKYEGWHHARDQPYVGYGHRLLSTDTFSSDITEHFADSLLRGDLKKKCAVFREFGKDSLLLGVLAYNVGEYRVLQSVLVRKLKAGKKNIRDEYLSFRKCKGKIIRSLEKRRRDEFELLNLNR